MFYYKKGKTYIASHSEVLTAEEITAEEYNRVKSVIDNRPTAPEGFAYRLTGNMEWEMYEVEETDPELTEAETLDIILGGEG